MRPCGAYIVHANKDAPLLLCVRDYNREAFYEFEISLEVASRLAAECSDRVNAKISGVDFKKCAEEIALELSRLQQERGLPSG